MKEKLNSPNKVNVYSFILILLIFHYFLINFKKMETKSLNLPQPGELVINNDYLEPNKDINKITSLKIIQWNIERGYKIDLIISDLIKQNADILLLQEIDIDCERSNHINCLTILAQKLKMSYAYVSEFCELYDKVRKAKDQGGGVHGNAIFAKFPISKENTIVVKHKYQPVIWDKEGYSRKEPRKGDRYFISSMFKFNENVFVDVYSLHLEVFCGITGRIQQFSDVPLYTEQRRKSVGDNNKIIQLIGGDLNTMAHGVARFSPKYCGNDWMRLKTIGKSEGTWWLENALMGGKRAVDNLKSQGFSEDVYKNYEFFEGFVDPWDVNKDFTHEDWIWYKGKLDWLFLRGGKLEKKFTGNDDYSMSDHKYLGMDVNIEN